MLWCWEVCGRVYVDCTLSFRWLVPLLVYTMKHLHRSRRTGERAGGRTDRRTDEPTLFWVDAMRLAEGEGEREENKAKRMAIVGAICTFCSGDQRRLGAQFFSFQQLLWTPSTSFSFISFLSLKKKKEKKKHTITIGVARMPIFYYQRLFLFLSFPFLFYISNSHSLTSWNRNSLSRRPLHRSRHFIHCNNKYPTQRLCLCAIQRDKEIKERVLAAVPSCVLSCLSVVLCWL